MGRVTAARPVRVTTEDSLGSIARLRRPPGADDVVTAGTDQAGRIRDVAAPAVRARYDMGGQVMVGALLLGFVAGVIARILMPGDAFRKMSGPVSWLISVGLGLAGALLGYVIFTLGLGIGDDDIFDWGGLLSAIIGTLIVLPVAGWLLRRNQRGSV